MNLIDIRTIVRRDLHDEDIANYRWTNDELDRHITHAVKDYSEEVPYEQKAVKTTTFGSREIDIASLSDRINVEAVEFPAGYFPRRYQRFSLWGDTITLLGIDIPDGTNAFIYYGKLHTLNVSNSTIAARHEDLIATGACGYAAVEWAIYAVNRVNIAGNTVTAELLGWGREKLDFFDLELKKLGRKNRVRVRSLYRPFCLPVTKSTDYGP